MRYVACTSLRRLLYFWSSLDSPVHETRMGRLGESAYNLASFTWIPNSRLNSRYVTC